MNRDRFEPCRNRRGSIFNRQPGSVVATTMVLAALTAHASSEIPTALSDKIYKGSGTIDLLRDISADNLQTYLQKNGGAYFGVDLNENLAGNETSKSLGVALKSVKLVLKTTEGTVSFGDFYTSSTAKILELGASAPSEFYTLYGTAGSASITGNSKDFEPSKLEDVVAIRDVAFSGKLLDAQLYVSFLNTADTRVDGNETFFDWSGGPEDFALLDVETAKKIAANAVKESNDSKDSSKDNDDDKDSSSSSDSSSGSSSGPSSGSSSSSGGKSVAPGAPAPPFAVLAMLGAWVAWRYRRHE